MLLYLVVILGQWSLAALVGLLVLSVVPADIRRRLWLAAPTIGLGTAVVALSWTSLVLATRIATPLLVLGALVAAAVQVVRHRHHIGRRAAVATLTLVACGAAGGVGTAVAVLPAARTDAGTVMVTSNHDAFFYVSGAEWLASNPATDLPVVTTTPADGDDPPATGPAQATLDLDLRLGDMLLSAAASTLTGEPVSAYWSWQVAGWLLVLPGTFAGVAHLLWDRRSALGTVLGAAAGVVAGVSSLVVLQAYNQNAASLLGLVQVPLALALWWSHLRLDDVGRPPRWLVALVLSGTLGAYSEYAPLAAFGFGATVLARPLDRLPGAIGRAATTVALAVALAPPVWWRLVSSLLVQGDLPNTGWISPFHDAPFDLVAARVVGGTTAVGPGSTITSTPVTVVLAATTIVGLALLLWRHRSRWVWAGFGAGATTTAWYLTTQVENLYSQQRVIEIAQPVALGVAILGWGSLARSVDGRGLVTRCVAVAPVAAATVLLAAGNLRLVDDLLPPTPQLEHRAVDDDYAEAARWADRYGGRAGEDLTIVVQDFVESLWLTDALRDHTEAAYLFLYGDYHYRASYTDGRLDRYVLTGRSIPFDGDPGAVVARNDRFTLYDRSQGEVAVVAPTSGFHAPEGDPDDASYWLSDEGELLVVRSADGPARLVFEATPLVDLGDVPIEVTTPDGRIIQRVLVRGGALTTFDIPLPDEAISRLVLRSTVGARPPSASSDPRHLSVYLGGFSLR